MSNKIKEITFKPGEEKSIEEIFGKDVHVNVLDVPGGWLVNWIDENGEHQTNKHTTKLGALSQALDILKSKGYKLEFPRGM